MPADSNQLILQRRSYSMHIIGKVIYCKWNSAEVASHQTGKGKWRVKVKWKMGVTPSLRCYFRLYRNDNCELTKRHTYHCWDVRRFVHGQMDSFIGGSFTRLIFGRITYFAELKWCGDGALNACSSVMLTLSLKLTADCTTKYKFCFHFLFTIVFILGQQVKITV